MVLYGEELETVPDPNQPENVVHYKAKSRERAEKFKRFMVGEGSVLFAEWRKKVRTNQARLLSIPEKDMCKCDACIIIRDTRKYLELLLEAEQLLSKK